MGDILIRNIPDQLKAELAQLAGEEGSSLSAAAVDVLWEGINAKRTAQKNSGLALWRALREDLVNAEPDELDLEYERIMEEVEAERKSDFGRPLPDLE